MQNIVGLNGQRQCDKFCTPEYVEILLEKMLNSIERKSKRMSFKILPFIPIFVKGVVVGIKYDIKKMKRINHE